MLNFLRKLAYGALLSKIDKQQMNDPELYHSGNIHCDIFPANSFKDCQTPPQQLSKLLDELHDIFNDESTRFSGLCDSWKFLGSEELKTQRGEVQSYDGSIRVTTLEKAGRAVSNTIRDLFKVYEKEGDLTSGCGIDVLIYETAPDDMSVVAAWWLKAAHINDFCGAEAIGTNDPDFQHVSSEVSFFLIPRRTLRDSTAIAAAEIIHFQS